MGREGARREGRGGGGVQAGAVLPLPFLCSAQLPSPWQAGGHAGAGAAVRSPAEWSCWASAALSVCDALTAWRVFSFASLHLSHSPLPGLSL